MVSGRHITKKQRLLFLIGAAILLVGLGSAVAIYLTADEASDGEQEYEVAGSFIYPAMNERSKRYQHDLQMYGGKAAVMADDINRWFDSLWRGRTLAFTVAVIAAFLSFWFFAAAGSARPDLNADSEQEAGRI